MTALATVPARAVRPHWTERAAPFALTWSLLYGATQVWFAFGHEPRWRYGLGLFVPAWGAAGLCVAAAAVVAGLSVRPRWPLVVAGWLVSVALAVSSGLLLLDLVGTVLPGMGLSVQWSAAATRLGGVAGAVLVGATALAGQRRLRSSCAACGRTDRWVRATGTPVWAWAGAYAAVAGCAVRLGAQIVAGWGDVPLVAGVTLGVFEVLFVLAGTVLPLGLVHRWGRVWPRWVVPVAGRRVPRWLPLGPAVVLSAGITSYFGVGLGDMVVGAFRGVSAASGPYHAWFFWTAVPAYVVWGVGLGVAAAAYGRVSRAACGRCGRG